MFDRLKRRNNSDLIEATVEEVQGKLEQAEVRNKKLDERKSILVEQKRRAVLAGQDATILNDEIAQIDRELADYENVLLPELMQELESAEGKVLNKESQERIRQIQTEEEKAYNESQGLMQSVINAYALIPKNLDRLGEIVVAHESNANELRSLNGTRDPTLDWNVLKNFLGRMGR